MTVLPETSSIDTSVYAITRLVVSDVLESAGLAVMRGPVGIGKSYALRKVIAEMEEQGHKVTFVTATGGAQSKISEFLRTIHGRKDLTSAQGVEVVLRMLEGHPFRTYGQRSVLIGDEAQDLAAPFIPLLRGWWDTGELARLGDPRCPAFGLILVGNDQILTSGAGQNRIDQTPFWDRVTHDIDLPRPSKEEYAAFALALFPNENDGEMRAIVQAFGEDKGSFRAAQKAARQAYIRAQNNGEPVCIDHLSHAIRMMGGRV